MNEFTFSFYIIYFLIITFVITIIFCVKNYFVYALLISPFKLQLVNYNFDVTTRRYLLVLFAGGINSVHIWKSIKLL